MKQGKGFKLDVQIVYRRSMNVNEDLCEIFTHLSDSCESIVLMADVDSTSSNAMSRNGLR